MKPMIPFYYAVVALFLGLVCGFCAKCYQHSNGNFFTVLKRSVEFFMKISVVTLLLPLLVIFSEGFRKILLNVLIREAAADYNEKERGTVNLSNKDLDILVSLLLAKISVFNFSRIAIGMLFFYLSNLSLFAIAMIKRVAEMSESEQSTNLNVCDGSFYRNSVFVRKLVCL